MEEKTLAIIKPDGVSRSLIGTVIKRLEEEGLNIVAMKMIRMTKTQAKGFYKVHQGNLFLTVLQILCHQGHVWLWLWREKR